MSEMKSWNCPHCGGTIVPDENGKPVTISFDDLKDRGVITLNKMNADKETLLKSTVKIKLQKGKFTEELEVPFAERPARRR